MLKCQACCCDYWYPSCFWVVSQYYWGGEQKWFTPSLGPKGHS